MLNAPAEEGVRAWGLAPAGGWSAVHAAFLCGSGGGALGFPNAPGFHVSFLLSPLRSGVTADPTLPDGTRLSYRYCSESALPDAVKRS